jgi:hypothetical protein
MHTIPKGKKGINSKRRSETPRERLERLYNAQGGPLMGWLQDEAEKRGHNPRDMARFLGVNYGYVQQLISGIRQTSTVPQEFADACSRYLDVPTIVVKLLAGNIRMSDFLFRSETEEDATDRAIRQIQSDPHLCEALPRDLIALPTDAKKAIALMYAEVTSNDLFNAKELPDTVYWLQRAALNIDDASANVGE